MLKHFKIFTLATGIFMLFFFFVSCTRETPVDATGYTVSVKMNNGTILEDGTILTVPQLRVRVDHPDAADRIMQINAYAYNDRLSDAFREGQAGVMALDFEEFEDRMYDPVFDTEVQVTVVYGFDGSGGGPITIYDESFPLKFTLVSY